MIAFPALFWHPSIQIDKRNAHKDHIIMAQDSDILKALTLYSVYNIRYVRTVGNTDRIVTPRALFLGEFNKNKLGSSKFMPAESSDGESASSRYLGIGFLVYFPRASATESHGVISGLFEVIICDPEKGLVTANESHIITLSPDHYRINTIACGTTEESRKAFEKVYTIAVKTGLIDPSLENRNSDGTPKHLSRTVVRSIHKGFTEIIRMAP